MRKFLLFMVLSISLSAQKTELIVLKNSIKDRKSLAKSLTFIDNRTDKEIGNLAPKGETFEVKFADKDLKFRVEKWFSDDNKVKGNNDIVLMLEELKVYSEKNGDGKASFDKAKVKISSFIKRNNRYYFINRFDNVILSDPKRNLSAPRYLASQISEIITEFINISYVYPVSGNPIPETDITNYDSYLKINYKAFNSELKDGVYKSFKNFYNQLPESEYFVEKNKKGEIARVKNKNGQSAALSEIYCIVDNGKAYRITSAKFEEMHKDDKGFYIISSRKKLLSNSNGSDGIVIGALAAGGIGALIGGLIEHEVNKGSVNGFGYRSETEMNVYIDSLTGAYVFEK
ncbi:hypothetical protein NZ698_09930 [Chryseobacterium sp. PBS4-4]|uniref:Glycine zipper family protein n=1 Tax=Chryseobacterium edaphi TaxID=2976532 RepID=A0ABT2W5N9_9FLAO|nr:hypothetical protein [Chryseobacterium edaphi]MCU7617515.1 hypothetical protein [Chryseobacterium edaphi]